MTAPLLAVTPASAQDPTPDPKAAVPEEVQEGEAEEGEAEEGEAPPDPHRLEIAGFPVIAYSSDTGVGVGALGTLARFDPAHRPHRWRLDLLAVASLGTDPDGNFESPRQLYYADLDFPQAPTPDLRVGGRLQLTWLKIAGYYGLGNDSPDLEDFSDRAHEYEHVEPLLELRLRYNVVGPLYLFGWLEGSYNEVTVYDDSKLAADLAGDSGAFVQEALVGVEGHERGVLHLGVMWDTRDDEVVPSRGMFHQASGRVGGSASSEFVYAGANVTGELYVPLHPPQLVFATRLIGDLLFGEPPFYELGFLGDWNLQRGVPIGRFSGKIRLLGNFELRSRFWRFTVFGMGPMHLGAVAFTDLGRVWADYEDRPELDGDGLGLKKSFGGGLRMLWGESFIARLDFAWSPDVEGLGIYFGSQHAF